MLGEDLLVICGLFTYRSRGHNFRVVFYFRVTGGELCLCSSFHTPSSWKSMEKKDSCSMTKRFSIVASVSGIPCATQVADAQGAPLDRVLM